MSKRIIYHIVPRDDEKPWAIKKEGSDRVSSTHKTKDEAIDKARELAKDTKPSQIKIHGLDGKIQTEHTYKGDPEKYPG